jgi:hypothetical protein
LLSFRVISVLLVQTSPPIALKSKKTLSPTLRSLPTRKRHGENRYRVSLRVPGIGFKILTCPPSSLRKPSFFLFFYSFYLFFYTFLFTKMTEGWFCGYTSCFSTQSSRGDSSRTCIHCGIEAPEAIASMSLFKAISLRLSVVYDDTHPHRTRSICPQKNGKKIKKKYEEQNRKNSCT